MKPASSPAPRVSIVLPNRNHRPFLPERFASIAAQTLGDWELIVVDGESSDGSWEYIQAQAAGDGRIRAFQAAPRGPYAAWNAGVREARGEFVHIATSDDAMTPDCLAKLAAALDRHPDCDIAHCQLAIVDAEGRPVEAARGWRNLPLQRRTFADWIDRPHLRRHPHDGILHAATGTVTTSINQLLIRRGVFARAGFFREDFGVRADFEWGMRASLLHDTIHVPEQLAVWRRHPGQLTRDAEGTTPAAWREMAAMVRAAVAAATEAEPGLRVVLDADRLTRPMRHKAMLAERREGAWRAAQWVREPDLIGLDLWHFLGLGRGANAAHLDWIGRELRRRGIPGPEAVD